MEKQRTDFRERGGEGEMYGESNMETYTTICKTDSQWEFAVWLKQGLCNNLGEWDWEGDGRQVQEEGDKSVSMADSLRLDRKQQKQFIKKLYFK